MATGNPAARQQLARVVDVERRKLAYAVTAVRAMLTVAFLGVTLYFGLVQGDALWRGGVAPAAVYAGLSVGLLVAARQWPWVRSWVAAAVAVVDIPLLAWSQLSSLNIPGARSSGFGPEVPILSVLVLVAGLSFEPWTIALAACTAVASLSVILHQLGAQGSDYIAFGAGPLCAGAASMVIVQRVRALVRESRKSDFAGKYILGERLGAGGMAEVFRATYSPEGGFERAVAVKRILAAHAHDATFVELFRREAALGASLAHPNLVQVLDFGRHEDSWFLAMELVDGPSLRQVLRARLGQGLPPAAVVYLGCELAEALAYLHERSSEGLVGLVHRDLNPPNVLLSRGGEVKLSDLGVARWQNAAALTATGWFRGKLGYSAPEQLAGEQPSPSWDLFALGLTLHESLTGHPVFVASNDAALVRQVMEAPIAPPSMSVAGLPRAVDELVMGLLERDVARRTSSARAVAAALRALAAELLPDGRRLLVELTAGMKESNLADRGSDEAMVTETTATVPSRPASP